MKSRTFGIGVGLLTFVVGTTAAICLHRAPVQKSGQKIEVAQLPPVPVTRSKILIPKGWKKIDAEGEFTFYLPPEIKQTDIAGIDEFYREYSNGRITVGFVYDPMGFTSYESRHQVYGDDLQETSIEVDGRKATLITYRRKADKHHPQTFNAEIYVGEWAKAQVKMRMWVSSRKSGELEIAARIFNTIDLP